MKTFAITPPPKYFTQYQILVPINIYIHSYSRNLAVVFLIGGDNFLSSFYWDVNEIPSIDVIEAFQVREELCIDIGDRTLWTSSEDH